MIKRMLERLAELRRRWRCRGLPDALIKATYDPDFSYALQLRNGQRFAFRGAALCSDRRWIHLAGLGRSRTDDMPREDGIDMLLDRGIDVRVDEIIWAADAPYGS